MKKAALLLVSSIAFATSAHAGLFNSDEKVQTEEGIHSFKSFKPAAVRAEVGTLGYGGALVFSANPSVDVEAGFSSADEFSVLKDVKVNDAKYDLDMDPNKNAYLNAKLRPFKNNFHVTTGVIWQDNRISAKAKDNGGGTLKVDGNEYSLDANSLGNVKATLDFKNEFAPYLGIGFSPKITNRWGLFGEIGAAYVGGSDISVYSTAPLNQEVTVVDGNGNKIKSNKTVADVLNEVEKEIDDKGIVSEVLPVAKVGVTVRF